MHTAFSRRVVALALSSLSLVIRCPAQQPRVLVALDEAAATELVLAGSYRCELQDREADEDSKPELVPGVWQGPVELLRAKSGDLLSSGQGKASFAVLTRRDQSVVEARLGAETIDLALLTRVLPNVFDLAPLRKWVLRAASRGRVDARKASTVEDGLLVRIALPARALMSRDVGTDNDSDKDDDAESDASGTERRASLARFEGAKLEITIDGKNRLVGLRLEIVEVALEEALAKASPEGDLDLELFNEARERYRRVHVFELQRREREAAATRAALGRLEAHVDRD